MSSCCICSCPCAGVTTPACQGAVWALGTGHSVPSSHTCALPVLSGMRQARVHVGEKSLRCFLKATCPFVLMLRMLQVALHPLQPHCSQFEKELWSIACLTGAHCDFTVHFVVTNDENCIFAGMCLWSICSYHFLVTLQELFLHVFFFYNLFILYL